MQHNSRRLTMTQGASALDGLSYLVQQIQSAALLMWAVRARVEVTAAVRYSGEYPVG